MMTLNFTLNGKEVTCLISPEMTLLTVLKEVLHINSVKRACLGGECGACTVILDGNAVNSCLVFAATVEGKSVTTVEGIGTPDNLHPVQKAFLESGAFQCGFCTPGFIMSSVALLAKNPHPTEDEIRYGLSGNLCRCTGYVKPVEALKKLAGSDVNPDAVKAVQDAVERMGR